jgi:hypothetical protein
VCGDLPNRTLDSSLRFNVGQNHWQGIIDAVLSLWFRFEHTLDLGLCPKYYTFKFHSAVVLYFTMFGLRAYSQESTTRPALRSKLSFVLVPCTPGARQLLPYLADLSQFGFDKTTVVRCHQFFFTALHTCYPGYSFVCGAQETANIVSARESASGHL